MRTVQEEKARRDERLATIAKAQLGIVTLETRNSDSLDFHDLSVCGAYASRWRRPTRPGSWPGETLPALFRSHPAGLGLAVPAHDRPRAGAVATVAQHRVAYQIGQPDRD